VRATKHVRKRNHEPSNIMNIYYVKSLNALLIREKGQNYSFQSRVSLLIGHKEKDENKTVRSFYHVLGMSYGKLIGPLLVYSVNTASGVDVVLNELRV
jgi:hypothetical protein